MRGSFSGGSGSAFGTADWIPGQKQPISDDTIDRACTLIYRIDPMGRVAYVNPVWDEFARNNHGESVLAERILGTSLMAAITDKTVRELYVRIIERARAGVPMRFRYRCDAPDKCRTFEMNVGLREGGEVEFVSTLLHEETRPAITWLESGVSRDERMLRVCSWCQKVALPDDNWVPVEEAVEILHLLEADRLPRITHGICDPCKVGMRASVGL